jgi:putative heme-binding domain-containing protein
LDGIGNWGLQALTEKVLDPNRNISQAFVNYSITLEDGSVKQGLFRRDEGSSRVFADLAGQEFSIPAAQIVKQSALPFTLMPDNFYTTISESDYYHLMEYLLDQN